MWFQIPVRPDETGTSQTFRDPLDGEVVASREGEYWRLGSSQDWSGRRATAGRRWERVELPVLEEVSSPEEPMPEGVRPNLSILEGTLRELRAVVEESQDQEWLLALRAAEWEGKGRAGAMSLLDRRIQELKASDPAPLLQEAPPLEPLVADSSQKSPDPVAEAPLSDPSRETMEPPSDPSGEG